MNRKRTSALLLGGSGFIGFGIAKFLKENRDYDITIVDDFSAGGDDPDFRQYCTVNDIALIPGDLSIDRTYGNIGEGYDHVYVLASVVGVNRCIAEPHSVIRINTGIIQCTTEWLKHSKPKRVVFASSSENYAATTDRFAYSVPTDENVPLCIADTRHPRFSYAVTKMLGESAFFSYGRQLGIHTTVVRYQNIYGPRMGFKHAIPHIIERFYKGEEPIRMFGHDQTRAFCYRSDASEGTVLALESDKSNQEVYHIGTDQEISIDALTRTIGSIVGYNGRYEPAPTYPGSVSRRCPDIGKARSHFGYRPKVSLQEGLSQTVEWYLRFFESGKAIPTGGFLPPDALEYVDGAFKTDSSR